MNRDLCFASRDPNALEFIVGEYLLTCPKTKEQYIGMANSAGGFWQRWMDYCQTGHGGNVALWTRDPSDYQVSILEVAGTSATDEQIAAMEALWKLKLQSREMGLNLNRCPRAQVNGVAFRAQQLIAFQLRPSTRS